MIGATLAETYIIDSLLGEGGMGCVYLARHTRLEAKRFAIKVLHEEFSQHREALARFKREAEATALISSPHVIGVHDVGSTADGRPFMACDYLEGEELAERLRREGQLAVGEAVRIVRQICLGLAAAHQHGIIHRDVKPENVYLVGPAEGSTAKLLDFGISRLQRACGKALTQAGVALGTPDYMSPEQARGQPVDYRSDIYALGLLLYVTLTGVSPFERGTPQESLIALLTTEAPPPREFEAGIPSALEVIVIRAMAKDPGHRVQSVPELWSALAPFDPSSGAPPPAKTETQPPAPTPRPPDHHVPQSPVAAAGSGVLSAGPASVAVAVSPPERQLSTASERASRNAVMLAGGVGAAVALPAMVLAVGGFLRALRVDLGGVSWLLIAMVMAAGIVGLAVLARTYIVRSWWSGLALERLRRVLSATVASGVSGYALATLGFRCLQIVLLEEPKDLGKPIYDLLPQLIALMVAAGGGLLAARMVDEVTDTEEHTSATR